MKKVILIIGFMAALTVSGQTLISREILNNTEAVMLKAEQTEVQGKDALMIVAMLPTWSDAGMARQTVTVTATLYDADVVQSWRRLETGKYGYTFYLRQIVYYVYVDNVSMFIFEVPQLNN
jgi:hypothetical protein